MSSATNGSSGSAAPSSAAALADEPTVEILPSEKEADDTHIDSLVKPLVDSAAAAEPALASELAPLDIQSVKPSHPAAAKIEAPEVSAISPRSAQPAIIKPEIASVELSLPSAAATPGRRPAFKAAEGWNPKAHEREAEPVPSRRRSVAFLRGRSEAAEAIDYQLAVADLVSAPKPNLTAAESATGSQTTLAAKASETSLPPKSGSLAFVSSKIDLAGESLIEMLRALEKSAEALEQAGILALRETFDAPPATLLLAPPQEIVAAPAPPCEKWLRSPKLVFTAQAPTGAGLAVLSAGPQAPPLAGPCLPPQLRNFTKNSTLSHGPDRKRSGTPTWLISVLVATALFLGAGSLLQYLTTNRDAKAASVAAAAPQANESAAASGIPVAQEHPGARFVEVAGVRVLAPANKRPQIQYLVVNHSLGELNGLNIHIAVHSADAPTGPPLFSVSSVISSLAANQSKEIRTDLDLGLNPSSLPDWQNLRTEILITRQ